MSDVQLLNSCYQYSGMTARGRRKEYHRHFTHQGVFRTARKSSLVHHTYTLLILCSTCVPIGTAHRPRSDHPARSHPRERNDLHRRLWLFVPHPSFCAFWSLTMENTQQDPRINNISKQNAAKPTSSASYTPSTTRTRSTGYLPIGFLTSAN